MEIDLNKTAKLEYECLRTAARFARMGLMSSNDQRALLVDGSQFSPSTRAIGSSEMVYQLATPEEWEAYDKELDELIDSYNLDGWSMGWVDGPGPDQGCLFLYSPDYKEAA